MKTKALVLSAALVLLVAACKNSSKQNNETAPSTSDTTTAPKTTAEVAPAKGSTFNIDHIPVSHADLGEFPFFSLPAGLQSQNKPVFKSFDRLFFPLDGIMTPVEGKVWKSYIVMAQNSKEDWSLPYFEKSYDDAITQAGGVKVFDDKVSLTELDRIKEKAVYFGEEGSLDYWNDPAKVYIIRREDKGDIYIQLSGNTAQGQLQILQKAPFKQTITLLRSAEIEKLLAEKGKAVLHINFDTDKATLKPDGKEAVAEIVKVLAADKNLKLDINGYTDNTGSEDQNLQLSVQRAATVKNEIIVAGIDKERLASSGFGAQNPIADNGTEEGKADNRRVELVKK